MNADKVCMSHGEAEDCGKHLTISKNLLHSLLVQRLLRAQQEGFLQGPPSGNKIP